MGKKRGVIVLLLVAVVSACLWYLFKQEYIKGVNEDLQSGDRDEWQESHYGFQYPNGWSMDQLDGGGINGIYFADEPNLDRFAGLEPDATVLTFEFETAKVDFFDSSTTPELKSFDSYVTARFNGQTGEEVVLYGTPAIRFETEGMRTYMMQRGEYFETIEYPLAYENVSLLEMVIEANIACVNAVCDTK